MFVLMNEVLFRVIKGLSNKK